MDVLEPYMGDGGPNGTGQCLAAADNRAAAVVPVKEPLHFSRHLIRRRCLIMNDGTAADNLHWLGTVSISPASHPAGELLHDNHRLPTAQYFMAQGAVPVLTDIDNQGGSPGGPGITDCTDGFTAWRRAC